MDEHGGCHQVEIWTVDPLGHGIQGFLQGPSYIYIPDHPLYLGADWIIHFIGDMVQCLHKAKACPKGIGNHGEHISQLVDKGLLPPLDGYGQHQHAHNAASYKAKDGIYRLHGKDTKYHSPYSSAA